MSSPAPQLSPSPLRRSSHRVRAVIILGVLVLSGCANVPGLKSAQKGDYKSLRSILAQEQLKPGEVRRLAAETLSWEVRESKDREDRAFVRSLSSCSGQLTPSLRERAKNHDGVGAEAAFILLENGKLRKGTEQYAADEDGAWRALHARSANNNGEQRRSYFSDPDQRVRRAALTAAREVASKDDIELLLEVSRLDPDALARSRAFQALGRIGTERVALALKDRFSTAEEELRLSIIDAWGQKALYELGGRRELTRLLSHNSGFDAIFAAQILTKDKDVALRNQSYARLTSFTKDGTTQERRMALRFLPQKHAQTIPLLLTLAQDEDEQVAVIAWARLLGSKEHRAKSQAALTKWADSTSPLAYQARAALSASGDQDTIPLMQRQLNHDDPNTRKQAGLGLLRLSAWQQVAQLLADPDAGVRRTIACKVLARPLSGRSPSN